MNMHELIWILVLYFHIISIDIYILRAYQVLGNWAYKEVIERWWMMEHATGLRTPNIWKRKPQQSHKYRAEWERNNLKEGNKNNFGCLAIRSISIYPLSIYIAKNGAFCSMNNVCHSSGRVKPEACRAVMELSKGWCRHAGREDPLQWAIQASSANTLNMTSINRQINFKDRSVAHFGDQLTAKWRIYSVTSLCSFQLVKWKPWFIGIVYSLPSSY